MPGGVTGAQSPEAVLALPEDRRRRTEPDGLLIPDTPYWTPTPRRRQV